MATSTVRICINCQGEIEDTGRGRGPGRPRSVCDECKLLPPTKRVRQSRYGAQSVRGVTITTKSKKAADAVIALHMSVPLFVPGPNVSYERIGLAQISEATGISVGDLYGAIRRRFEAAKRWDTIIHL